ncbi:hypothetical protein PRUPE_2G035300 [Prunus persica]|uniref:Uncharacterized protein n=1 Tax=Prunus persica TaxID=3760 RepID=A0A251QBM7_PRUPE|nr:hypothetical protein PRUPE_2G035300 [Prunus persica]
MVGWQRNLQSLISHIGKRVSDANFSSSSHFQRLWRQSPQIFVTPLYHYFQRLGISSPRNLLADLSVESDGESNEEHNQKLLNPHKFNLFEGFQEILSFFFLGIFLNHLDIKHIFS